MPHRSAPARKLSRQSGQRRALLRGLANSLVLHESIVTTEAKARELVPAFERLVTQAKRGGLAAERSLRQFLLTDNAARKLISELAPAWKDRTGGYARLTKAGTRSGDNALLAAVSLILPETRAAKPPVKKTDGTARKEQKPAEEKETAQ